MSAALEAGRDLDVKIAERLFGWKHLKIRGRGMTGNQPGFRSCMYLVPRYSTDIAAAWEVVKHFRGVAGCDVRVSCLHNRSMCEIEQDSGAFDTADADTAPLAICRAALSVLRPTGDQP